MDWIRAHLAVMEWVAAHVGIPIFAAIGGFVAARWTDRISRKASERRATVYAAVHLAEFVRFWRDEFMRQEGRAPDQTGRTQWDAAEIVSPLRDPKVLDHVAGLRTPARDALLDLDERAPLYAAEIKRLLLWQEHDVYTDAPAVLAEFVLAADDVLQAVRQEAGIPGLPDDVSGLAYVRTWLRDRKDFVARRDAWRLADQTRAEAA